jgi:hypothetical protein
MELRALFRLFTKFFKRQFFFSYLCEEKKLKINYNETLFTTLVTGDSESIVEILKKSAGKLCAPEKRFQKFSGHEISPYTVLKTWN